MTSLQQKHAEFERQKNVKALSYTTIITIGIFLLFLISWTIPQPVPPPIDEGIEVNLGNSETGMGDVPPQIPGEMSNQEQTTVAAPQTTQAEAETNPEVADNNEADAPVIHTSPKPEVKKNTDKPDNTTVQKSTNKPVVNTPPKVVKPKAVYGGGKSNTGTGNNADSYNNARDQGIAGGKGDQGKPNGNPNSDSYTGNGGSGKGGLAYSSNLANRGVIYSPKNLQFGNDNGKIFVNVQVNSAGKVIKAWKKTTTGSFSKSKPGEQSAEQYAIEQAYKVTFKTSSSETETGVITFQFGH